jgi:hypothetical protein
VEVLHCISKQVQSLTGVSIIRLAPFRVNIEGDIGKPLNKKKSDN